VQYPGHDKSLQCLSPPPIISTSLFSEGDEQKETVIFTYHNEIQRNLVPDPWLRRGPITSVTDSGVKKGYCHIVNRSNGLEIVYTVETPWWEHPLILTTPFISFTLYNFPFHLDQGLFFSFYSSSSSLFKNWCVCLHAFLWYRPTPHISLTIDALRRNRIINQSRILHQNDPKIFCMHCMSSVVCSWMLLWRFL